MTAITKYHELGHLEQKNYRLWVEEARSLKSRWQQGQALCEDWRGRCLIASF